MKNTLLIVTLPILVSACAASSIQPAPAVLAEAPIVVSPADNDSSKVEGHAAQSGNITTEPRANDGLPSVALTKEILYKVLSSEIAFQRGDWQNAYVQLLSLAQQTRDPRLASRATEIALTAKHTDGALTAARLWRTLAPNSDEATQYYLSLIVLSDNLTEAQPILEQRLKEARPQTRGLLAFQVQRLLARATNKSAAFALLEQILRPYFDLPEAHLALAQGAYVKGDMERAHEEAQAALKSKPDSELAILALAQATLDRAESLKLLEHFVANYPNARDVRIAYARMLIEQKQYTKARGEFEALLKKQPQDLTSLYALGILGIQTNDFKAAEHYLTTYLNILSTKPDEERDPNQALLLLAQIAEERKDSEAALKWLAQVQEGEAYLNAQIRRAQVVAKRGDIAGARKLLHEVGVNGEREQAQIIIAEGQLLRDANLLQESLDVLSDGLKRFPSNTDILYDYAMVAEKRNQWELMESSLRKLIALAPDNQHAYNALGYSLAERNIRLEEAYALIDKALKLAPDDPFIIDSMGWVQFRLGKLKEAEALLRRAYELRPDVEIAAHLGEVLWVKGQKEDAQTLWRDAQTKDPQNDTLKNTLARLNVSL